MLIQPQTFPPSRALRAAAVLLCAAWLLAGAIGHDPWKYDDALHLGIAHAMSQGDFWLPQVAGEPWLFAPPLYYWLAGLCARLFGALLPWHDAARLASPVLGGLALYALAGARRAGTGASGLLAPVVAVGTLGLIAPLHDAQPAIAAFAGYAMTLCGLQQAGQGRRTGAIWLGLGLAVAFLGTGLDGVLPPLLLVAAAISLPAWRRRTALIPLILGLALALPLILPWPLYLNARAPALAATWWANEWASLVPRGLPGRDHAELLGWAAWPLWPLAAWHLWRCRRTTDMNGTALALAASLIGLALFLTDDARPIQLLPLLAPLSLLAAAGAESLRRGAAGALDWFGMMTFSLLAALLWLGGIAIATGEPARVAKNFTKPAPGFIADLSIGMLLLAIGASVAWIAVMLRMPRGPWRAAMRWSCGAAMAWLLLCCLWLPWIDYGKSYRRVATELQQALGPTPGCIERRGLGAAQRASLDYFAAIRTQSRRQADGRCRLLLVQTSPASDNQIAGWQLVLETARPGDRGERLRLYRR